MRKCCPYSGTDDCAPCVPWWAYSKSKSKSKQVDPQMRWRKPLRGFTGYTSTKYVCGYAYVGDYD